MAQLVYIGNNPLSGTDPTGYACTGSNIESKTCEDTGAKTTQVAGPSATEMNDARAAKAAAGGGSGHVTQSTQVQGSADTKGNDVGKSNDSGAQPSAGTPAKNAPSSEHLCCFSVIEPRKTVQELEGPLPDLIGGMLLGPFKALEDIAQGMWEHDANRTHMGMAGVLMGVVPDLEAGVALLPTVNAVRQDIATAWGVARQSMDATALAARQQVQDGAMLFRAGTVGRSEGAEAQFWSLEHPSTLGYAARYGIPEANVARANFVEAARLRPGTDFVTRRAPGIGGNPGGGVEAVVPRGGVEMQWFSYGEHQ